MMTESAVTFSVLRCSCFASRGHHYTTKARRLRVIYCRPRFLLCTSGPRPLDPGPDLWFIKPMSIWSLFAVGFILGLTGAMAPGPLLTVTITESAKRGGHVGPLVVLGHGILEIILLLLIIIGLGSVLASRTLYTIFSFCGGIVMIWMSIGIMKSLPGYELSADARASGKGLHPVVAGIVISLSNPYWFIWWLTIGMGYVMFAKGLGLTGILAFFIGHISSDLVWYSFVSYSIHMGRKYVRTRVIKGILFVCSLFLFFFGLFFVFKSYQFLAQT